MHEQQLDPFRVFAGAFGATSFAGLAALLRSGRPISWMSVLTAMLNTGMLGLAIALIWYWQFRGSEENVYFMIGICVLSGLGGTTAIDFVAQLFRRGGLHITIHPGDPDAEDEVLDDKSKED